VAHRCYTWSMPGAAKGSFKAGTPKRATSQKKMSRAAQSSKAPAPTIAKPAAHGGKRALLEGRASLLVKLVTRKESALNLLSLAQIYVDLEKWSKAKEALERCMALDPADVLQARCLLAPLLLNLGEQGEAEQLLQRWQAADAATAASLGVAGATMLCTRLLLALAKWDGDDEGEALCQAAFDAAFAHNWHALLLVCAVGNGDSPIPEGLVADLRERRLEALKKAGGVPVVEGGRLKQAGGAAGDAQPWPGAGGVAEAVLLSEAFAGFAGSEEEQEEAWPDLDGAQVTRSQDQPYLQC